MATDNYAVDLGKELEQITTTYELTADILGVHKQYARRIIDLAQETGEYGLIVTVHGRPYISLAELKRLAADRRDKSLAKMEDKDQREQNKTELAAARALERQERQRAKEEAAATKAAARAEKAANKKLVNAEKPKRKPRKGTNDEPVTEEAVTDEMLFNTSN